MYSEIKIKKNTRKLRIENSQENEAKILAQVNIAPKSTIATDVKEDRNKVSLHIIPSLDQRNLP